jgi:YHS domain-containing protein
VSRVFGHKKPLKKAQMKKLLTLLIVLASMATTATAKNLLNLDRNGAAIQGYDPVAFFTENQPVKGNPQFESEYHGAKYYFASAEHKAAFDKEPAKYEPQFGGYCAYGVSHNSRAPIKIEAWQIVNGRLLMQYDLDVKNEFNKDQQGTLRKADQNWPGLVEKYGR